MGFFMFKINNLSQLIAVKSLFFSVVVKISHGYK